jgi:hypothetical protein
VRLLAGERRPDQRVSNFFPLLDIRWRTVIQMDPSISAVVIVDDRGERIAAKYYSEGLKTAAMQQKLEASLLHKALRSNSSDEADIVLFDGHVAVMRAGKDVHLFVTGDADENEIILVEVLDALYESLACLLPGGNLEARTMMEKLDIVQLVLDELVDSGVILEIEPSCIVSRVGMKSADGGGGGGSVLPSLGGMGAAGAGGAGSSTQQAVLSFAEQMTRAFKAAGN